jgi:response regulator RpfG family c-di-GMP phosphodiesterase
MMTTLKPNIAMIDDNYDLIDTYKDLLESKYNVTEFYTAESYLQYLDQKEINPFEVVVTDYNLGAGQNGLDMIEKASRTSKSSAFILMSGYLDKESTLRAHNMGAHRILQKPIRIEALESEIQNLIYEFQVEKIRKETKSLTLQLKELCSIFDVFLEQHFSKTQIDDFFMRVLSPESTDKNISFRNYVLNIEEQLYRNMKMDEILMRQINNKKKTISI